MVNLIIKSFTGQSYELTSRSNPSRSSSAKRYSSDSYSTFRFVATLPLAPAQWVQILKSTHQRLPDFHSSHPGEVYQAVAEAIVRGDLSLYQLPSMNANHCLAGKKGFGLSIIKGPKPHSATDLSPESIQTAASAQQLLAELGISNEAFLGYLNGENLYNSYQKRNPLAEALGLLATGELLAYKIPLPPKTPSVKAQEFLPVTAADRPVPLAPETNFPVGSKAPTKSEIASAEGNSDEQVAARKEVAYDFYKKEGMPPSKIEGHTAGIDFSKPVEIISLPVGKTVNQYQVPGGPQGNYYAEPGIPPTKLGISDKAKNWKTGEIVTKEVNVYETNSSVKVLRSTAARIDDTWSIPNEITKTDGGAVQFFTMQSGKFIKK